MKKEKPKPILQVLDPGHKKWVQGGVFRDLRASGSKVFSSRPLYLDPPNSVSNFLSWIIKCLIIACHSRVLFSSLTPLENYTRFPQLRTQQILGLWFTHKDGDFNPSEIRALKRSTSIFIHSKREAHKIARACSAKQFVMLAAIEPSRFTRQAKTGKRIVWAGTPSERKNPELLLSIAEKLPMEEFLLIGKGWTESHLSSKLSARKNIEYREFQDALSVEDLDGSDLFIMTSRVEGGPMPLIETLAAGLIPIATDTGFVREIFEEGEVPESLIVPATDQDFVEAIALARKLSTSGFKPNRERILALNFPRLVKFLDANLI